MASSSTTTKNVALSTLTILHVSVGEQNGLKLLLPIILALQENHLSSFQNGLLDELLNDIRQNLVKFLAEVNTAKISKRSNKPRIFEGKKVAFSWVFRETDPQYSVMVPTNKPDSNLEDNYSGGSYSSYSVSRHSLYIRATPIESPTDSSKSVTSSSLLSSASELDET